ncbi:hypothetical protein vseg_020986 [Gypsophila vaccaria]
MGLSSKDSKRVRDHLDGKEDVKRAKMDVDVKVDSISDFPEPVLHQILSLLHPKDAARTCILSKRWQQVWKSYQILDFDLRRCHKMKRKSLVHCKNMMNQSLKCRQEQSLNIFKFRLRFNAIKNILPDVETWLSAAIERNVRELEIHAESIRNTQFCLPSSVMRGSSVTLLSLHGCILPTSKMKIDLPKLQKLTLKNVNIPLTFLVNLFSRCPLIDELRLIECTGFKSLSISSSNKLKRVDVHKCQALKSIVIESSKLESFWCFYDKKKLCEINLLACRALKDLVLEYPRMNDELFHDMISEFPLLEKLVLSRCYGLKTIKVSGKKLKKLVIRRCRKLVQAQIDAPNLVSLEYNGPRMPLSFHTLSCLKEALLRFDPQSKAKIDWKPEDAGRLQSFFCNNHLKGLKVMNWTKQKVDIFEDNLMAFDSLNKIKRSNSVKLAACFQDLLTEALKAWPYPSKLSVYSLTTSEFSEEIYKELNEGKEDPKCCAYFKNKCWRHYLKNITLEKWFSGASGQRLSLRGPLVQNTEFELDWNTNKHGRKKEISLTQNKHSKMEESE